MGGTAAVTSARQYLLSAVGRLVHASKSMGRGIRRRRPNVPGEGHGRSESGHMMAASVPAALQRRDPPPAARE